MMSLGIYIPFIITIILTYPTFITAFELIFQTLVGTKIPPDYKKQK